NIDSAVFGWTRQTGTFYIWQKNATKPAEPYGSSIFLQVTVAGGLITSVKDYRIPRSYVTSKWHDVRDPLYGAVGDGITADKVSIQAAFNAVPPVGVGRHVHVPTGSYFLGAYSTSADVIDLSKLGDDIWLDTDAGVEFVVNTTAAGAIPHVIYLRDNN